MGPPWGAFCQIALTSCYYCCNVLVRNACCSNIRIYVQCWLLLFLLWTFHPGYDRMKNVGLGQRTFPCPMLGVHVGKPSAIGQPTRPTQLFILSGSIRWVVTHESGLRRWWLFHLNARLMMVYFVQWCSQGLNKAKAFMTAEINLGWFWLSDSLTGYAVN